MYAQGACSKIASAILTNPTKRQLYAKNICYNTVFHILKEADPGFGGAKTELAHPEVKSVLFDPRSFNQTINIKDTKPVADSVVGIFKRQVVGAKAFEINHAAICINLAGDCLSTNNGVVGGGADYSQFNILKALDWSAGDWPTYNGDPSAPLWARERMVVFRPISQILR